MNHRQNSATSPSLSRRSFIATAASAPLVLASARTAFAADANSRVRLGVVGCGGRGSFVANLFKAHGGYELVTATDYFQDRVDALGGKLGIPAERRFTGLSGYKKVLECGVDAVAIMTPPFFHPEQAAAAIAAGKHVYVAKPIAVDVPGCQSIEASGKQAAAKGLSFLVDFQTRATDFYVEAVKRVHEGAIGELVFGESSYHCGRLGTKAKPGTPEARLRNWVFDIALSGDIVVEQNVHTLDVMSWIMNREPLRASGTGGRKVRVDVGDCWDHFTLTYEYPNNVGIAFSSRQFDGHGTKPDGILNRMFGKDGVLETKYGGNVMIRGKNFYRGGSTGTIYKEGAQRNVVDFHKAITTGKPNTSTVSPSVRSSMVTILGRTAAYESRVVTWDEIVKSTKRLDGKLDGLKA